MSVSGFVVYKLTPPPEMKQEDFIRFVLDEVFPAVKMPSTRVGMIVELHLFTTDAADKYIWVIGWNGLPTDVVIPNEIADARQKLESSGTLISAPSDFYSEVGRWVRSAQS